MSVFSLGNTTSFVIDHGHPQHCARRRNRLSLKLIVCLIIAGMATVRAAIHESNANDLTLISYDDGSESLQFHPHHGFHP